MRLNVKDRVDKLDISKNKLAKLLDISYPTLLEMYRGNSVSIRLDTLENLCVIFQCTPNDILVSDKIDVNTPKSLDTLPSTAFHDGVSNSLFEEIKKEYPDAKIISTKDYDKLLSSYLRNILWNIDENSDGSMIARPYVKLPPEIVEYIKNHKSDTK